MAGAQPARPRRAIAAKDPGKPARQYRGAVPARLDRIAEPALRAGPHDDRAPAPDRSERRARGRTRTRHGAGPDRRRGPGRSPPTRRGRRLRSRDRDVSTGLPGRPAAFRPRRRILRDAGGNGRGLGGGADPAQGPGRAQLRDLRGPSSPMPASSPTTSRHGAKALSCLPNWRAIPPWPRPRSRRCARPCCG